MCMCLCRIKKNPTHKHIRHDEYISPGPTVKNTKKYTKVIIQEKHSILYFQTGVMKTLRTTAARRIGQKQRLTTFFHPLCLRRISRTETLAGARITNTAASPQRPFHRWRSLKDAHVRDIVRYTERRPRFDWHHFDLLTGTCTISRKAGRGQSLRGASGNHAQGAAVVCMQDNHVSSYRQCRHPNATFHSLRKTYKYSNKDPGCKDWTSTWSQCCKDVDHRKWPLFIKTRYSKTQPQMK